MFPRTRGGRGRIDKTVEEEVRKLLLLRRRVPPFLHIIGHKQGWANGGEGFNLGKSRTGSLVAEIVWSSSCFPS